LERRTQAGRGWAVPTAVVIAADHAVDLMTRHLPAEVREHRSKPAPPLQQILSIRDPALVLP
jgi:hypothetical protein